MRLRAEQLQRDLDQLLDQVIATGRVIEVDRPGGTVVIAPGTTGSRLDRLPRREGVIVGDPEDLVSMDW